MECGECVFKVLRLWIIWSVCCNAVCTFYNLPNKLRKLFIFRLSLNFLCFAITIHSNPVNIFNHVCQLSIIKYKKDASNLSWSPLRSAGLVNSIALSDINNDGNVELVSLSTKTGNETILNIWTFPGIQFNHENFPWPQYGHDRYHTNQYGFIPPDEPVGIQPTSTNVPDKFSLSQNYPNPFNPATTIKFDIRNSAFTKLSVFDILGREIQTLVNEELKTGSYSLVFDGSEYNSGVYFYRLASGDFTETKRMLMVK